MSDNDCTGPVSGTRLDRRDLLTGVGMLAAVSVAAKVQPVGASTTNLPGPVGRTVPEHDDVLLTLTANEAVFLAAAVDRLIPPDALSPSASQAGVVIFMDRQLAGAWGSGARLYRSGPFLKGKPEHGYQLALTPREFFAVAIAAADRWVRAQHGAPFDQLGPDTRDKVLADFEVGRAQFDTVSAHAFFEAILAITIEGFLADPIYGGNRDKAGWKLLGFPGLPATYSNAVRSHKGTAYAPPVRSIEDFL